MYRNGKGANDNLFDLFFFLLFSSLLPMPINGFRPHTREHSNNVHAVEVNFWIRIESAWANRRMRMCCTLYVRSIKVCGIENSILFKALSNWIHMRIDVSYFPVCDAFIILMSVLVFFFLILHMQYEEDREENADKWKKKSTHTGYWRA